VSNHFNLPTPSLLTTTSNMSHQSENNTNAHYSVLGETATGVKFKGGHVTEDPSKQTVSFPLHVLM